MRRALLVAAAVSVAALSACGDSKSDREQVRDTAQSLLNSDKAVCGKLTESFSKSTFGGSKDRCEKAAEKGDKSSKARITKVAITGKRATVTVKDPDGNNRIALVDDGGWKIDRLVAAGDTGEVQARAAVEAFLGAIRGSNPQVFCGLLSERFARSVTGKKEFGVAECVQQVKKSGLKDIRTEVGSAGVQSVTAKGRSAVVSLSTGDTISLVRQGGRYVIDAINGNR